MKTALVYDRVNKWGGAERVLLSLHEIFPEAPLFTSVYDKDKASWAKVFPEVIPSFLQYIPFAKTSHEYFAPLMPLAFESHDFSEFDLVISVTSEAAKGIITSSNTIHLTYLLTPTRYLWSGHKTYFDDHILKLSTAPLVKYLKKWDVHASRRPDHIVAISKEVASRVSTYYQNNAEVIYPPFFELGKPKNLEKEDFYLVVSRLVSYKKVDIVIEAFNKIGKKLVVVGSGREKEYLRAISNNNIFFEEGLTDQELANYYERSRALIFPQVEDFGLVSLEAQSMGTPVIAFGQGGALETVVDHKTGLFFDSQSPEGIIKAIEEFENHKLDRKDMISNAKKFSKENFQKEFKQYIKNVVKL